MDSPLIQSSLSGLIDSFQTILADNYPVVLAFVAGILVWAILKGWVFSSSSGVGLGGGFDVPMMSSHLRTLEVEHDFRNRTWKGGGNEM